MSEQSLTTREFAKKIYLSESRIRELCRGHRIQAYKVGNGRKWRIPISELKRLEGQAQPSVEPEEKQTITQTQQEVSKEARIEQKPYEETLAGQEINLARSHKLEDHWNNLAFLANELAGSVWVPDLYWLWSEDPPSIPEEMDGLEAVASLMVPTADRITVDSKADHRLRPYLMQHLEVEEDWTHKISLLKVAVITFREERYSLVCRIKNEAQSKTWMSFSIKGDGLDIGFVETVYKVCLSHRLGDYEVVRGTALFYGGRPIADVPETNLRERVRSVHEELCQNVRDFPEFKKVLDAHAKLKEVFEPVRKNLEVVALRGWFNGKCTLCS